MKILMYTYDDTMLSMAKLRSFDTIKKHRIIILKNNRNYNQLSYMGYKERGYAERMDEGLYSNKKIIFSRIEIVHPPKKRWYEKLKEFMITDRSAWGGKK